MKVEDGELLEDADAGQEAKKDYSGRDDVNGIDAAAQSERNPSNFQKSGWSRRDSNQITSKMVNAHEFPFK